MSGSSSDLTLVESVEKGHLKPHHPYSAIVESAAAGSYESLFEGTDLHYVLLSIHDSIRPFIANAPAFGLQA